MSSIEMNQRLIKSFVRDSRGVEVKFLDDGTLIKFSGGFAEDLLTLLSKLNYLVRIQKIEKEEEEEIWWIITCDLL
jgi:hypothetical protein